MTIHTTRTRDEAIRASAHPAVGSHPKVVSGRTILLPSGNPAFLVGDGPEIDTVPARFAYVGSVIPCWRLNRFHEKVENDAHWQEAEQHSAAAWARRSAS